MCRSVLSAANCVAAETRVSMIAPDTFVGWLAIALAICLVLTLFTNREITSRLRLANSIRQRFGELAARTFLMMVAMVLLVAGWMILQDLRPSYASPNVDSDGLDQDAGDSDIIMQAR